MTINTTHIQNLGTLNSAEKKKIIKTIREAAGSGGGTGIPEGGEKGQLLVQGATGPEWGVVSEDGIALGAGAVAGRAVETNPAGLAIGNAASAPNSGLAIGGGADAGDLAMAIGPMAGAVFGAMAIGPMAGFMGSGNYSISLGPGASATHESSMALGGADSSGDVPTMSTADHRATLGYKELEVGHPTETDDTQTALILRDDTGGQWRITVDSTGALQVAAL